MASASGDALGEKFKRLEESIKIVSVFSFIIEVLNERNQWQILAISVTSSVNNPNTSDNRITNYSLCNQKEHFS